MLGLFFEHNEVAPMNNLWAGQAGRFLTLHQEDELDPTLVFRHRLFPAPVDQLGCMLKFPRTKSVFSVSVDEAGSETRRKGKTKTSYAASGRVSELSFGDE